MNADFPLPGISRVVVAGLEEPSCVGRKTGKADIPALTACLSAFICVHRRFVLSK
jgi:hypothetical protein